MSISINEYQQIATKADLNQLEFEVKRHITSLSESINAIRREISQLRNGSRQDREFYSPKDFADLVGLSKNTVIRRCQDGTYRSTQPGGEGTAILIPKSELERIKHRAENLI